jgi:fatty-acyl-CoA synthase
MAEFTFAPLSPVSFLERSSQVYADRTAIIDGKNQFSYREFGVRSRRLADALASMGIGPGQRVAALCANSHVMLELHHGVPLAGAALVALNTRLAEEELIGILRHCDPALLVATHEYAGLAVRLAARVGIPTLLADGDKSPYEVALTSACPVTHTPRPETDMLSLNYTSGTTGGAKGVMNHHRGAYLQALAMALHTRLTPESVYLWTLPMFHCNGWCFPWAVTAVGALHVCARAIKADEIWSLIAEHRVSHLSAAPTVLSMLAAEPTAEPLPQAQRPLRVQTGGSPPSPTLLASMADLGFEVSHLYGLTETFGPIALNDWQIQWDSMPADRQATFRARQGVANVISAPLRVVDDNGVDVPADGAAIGEIVCRGNSLMLGYYQDEAATLRSVVDGHFRTGDLAVMHPDGYVEIRDRAKDVIISGGENISSVEVERVLDSHPDVFESAVVGRPDPKWGEVPVAFVAACADAEPTAEELIAYTRERLAHFKAPQEIHLCRSLPKTATGKIKKSELRSQLVGDGTLA